MCDLTGVRDGMSAITTVESMYVAFIFRHIGLLSPWLLFTETDVVSVD